MATPESSASCLGTLHFDYPLSTCGTSQVFYSLGCVLVGGCQWLNISLYAVVIALLLPVALGQIMAKKHGLLAILFTIGMIYVNFQILIDVESKVSDHVGDSFALVVTKH